MISGGGNVPAEGDPRHSLDSGTNGEGAKRVPRSSGLDEEREHRAGSGHVQAIGEVQKGAGPCEDQQSQVEEMKFKKSIKKNSLFIIIWYLVLVLVFHILIFFAS